MPLSAINIHNYLLGGGTEGKSLDSQEEIIFELARVNTYAELGKALEALSDECLRVVAAEKSRVDGFENDAYLFFEACQSTAYVESLKTYCYDRRSGLSHTQSWANLVAPYEQIAEEKYPQNTLMPYARAYPDVMPNATEKEIEHKYRERHLEEFVHVLSGLSHFAADTGQLSWGPRVLARHIQNVMTDCWEQKFDVAPDFLQGFVEHPEKQMVQDMELWLRQRALMLGCRRQWGRGSYEQGIGSLFEQSMQGVESVRALAVHYETHCETLADYLAFRMKGRAFPAFMLESMMMDEKERKTSLMMIDPEKISREKIILNLIKSYLGAHKDTNNTEGVPQDNRFVQDSELALKHLAFDIMGNFVKPAQPLKKATHGLPPQTHLQ